MKQRRQFLKDLGLSSAALPFLTGLPGLQAAASSHGKQRLIIVFSPNGTVPWEFWPENTGTGFDLKRILRPLEPFRDRMLLLRGIDNKIKGDGDRHMRGMSCLLTGTRLMPGNIQGGSHTPAGWASGISIDQELRNFLQKQAKTRTRFGSLELGVAVPDRADPWTRMCYRGKNQPVAPIDDPRQGMNRLYGRMADREHVASILDPVSADLRRASSRLDREDRTLLDRHLDLVRELENRLDAAEQDTELAYPAPDLDPDIELVNDNTPEISRVQIDLLVNALANDMSRVATLQYMRSVGQARMSWLGIDEGHHGLSHEPDKNADAVEKLTRINEWFCGELAYLTKRLAKTPEPGADGSMLDNTLVVWLNELGKGNNHTLESIPFVLLGGKSHGVRAGRSLTFDHASHNRLWLAIAHAMGHSLDTFGNPDLCESGPLDLA